VVATDGAIVNHDIPRPQRNRIPLLLIASLAHLAAIPRKKKKRKKKKRKKNQHPHCVQKRQ